MYDLNINLNTKIIPLIQLNYFILKKLKKLISLYIHLFFKINKYLIQKKKLNKKKMSLFFLLESKNLKKQFVSLKCKQKKNLINLKIHLYTYMVNLFKNKTLEGFNFIFYFSNVEQNLNKIIIICNKLTLYTSLNIINNALNLLNIMKVDLTKVGLKSFYFKDNHFLLTKLNFFFYKNTLYDWLKEDWLDFHLYYFFKQKIKKNVFVIFNESLDKKIKIFFKQKVSYLFFSFFYKNLVVEKPFVYKALKQMILKNKKKIKKINIYLFKKKNNTKNNIALQENSDLILNYIDNIYSNKEEFKNFLIFKDHSLFKKVKIRFIIKYKKFKYFYITKPWIFTILNLDKNTYFYLKLSKKINKFWRTKYNLLFKKVFYSFKLKFNINIFKSLDFLKGLYKYLYKANWKLKKTLRQFFDKKKKLLIMQPRKKPLNRSDFNINYKWTDDILFEENKFYIKQKKLKRNTKFFPYFYGKKLPGDLEINFRAFYIKILPFNVVWTWSHITHKKIPSFLYYININRR